MANTSVFNASRLWTTLYHVTHQANVTSIYLTGLMPCLSRRLVARVWLCDVCLIPWALKHVCDSHGWQYAETAMVRATVPKDCLTRHRQGVFWSNVVIPPEMIGGCSIGSQYRNKWRYANGKA
jgi:hypothetical protein